MLLESVSTSEVVVKALKPSQLQSDLHTKSSKKVLNLVITLLSWTLAEVGQAPMKMGLTFPILHNALDPLSINSFLLKYKLLQNLEDILSLNPTLLL